MDFYSLAELFYIIGDYWTDEDLGLLVDKKRLLEEQVVTLKKEKQEILNRDELQHKE